MEVNRSELARLLGVALTTIDSYRHAGLPSRVEGHNVVFDVAEAFKWYRDYLERATKGATDSLEAAKLRELAASATLKELRVERERRNLVPAEYAAESVSRVLSNVRARLLALPQALAPEASRLDDPHQIEQLLRSALYDAMTEIAEEDEEIEGRA